MMHEATVTQGMQRSLLRPRTVFTIGMNAVVVLLTLLALTPLFAVLVMLIAHGLHRLHWEVFTQLPPVPLEPGGGFGNAIAGTLIMVSVAAVISVPVGILTALYLVEVGPDSRLAQAVRFAAKTLTGLPSILAGVFAFGVVVRLMGHFSALAGGVALSIIMVPTVILTAEQAIRSVPSNIKEAALAMGATQAQLVQFVVLPVALPGVLTGVMLAVARACGETAPLLFTALFSNYWPMSQGHVHLSQPTASLAVFIYNMAGMPYKNQQELAWTAALVLVAMVLVTNLVGRRLGRRMTVN
jgi:phosphate transport system permease protein